jgi:TonB family protein
MKSLESFMLAYLLNSLWQVPLVFAAAWLAARVVRRSSAAMEHRIWVSALVLATLLPACALEPAESLLKLLLWQLVRLWGTGEVRGEVRVIVEPGAALQHGVLRLPPALLAAIAIAYSCSVMYFAGRLAWGLWKTTMLRRQAERVALTGEAGRTWERCCRIFAVHDAETAVSPHIAGPVTIGVRDRLLLLPAGWLASLPADDLDAAIAHEFAHMRRRDFAKNLVYELLSLPIAYHPALWLMRSCITESREMICDAMAADVLAGREKYARSLLRLASTLSQPMPARTFHAIGIFDANIFERRVMNLTEKRVELRGARRMATAAICVALGLGACASALALRMEVFVPAAQSDSQPATSHLADGKISQSQPGSTTRVSAKAMAGNVLTKVDPVYPEIARAAKVSGTVLLRAVIGKDGTMQRLDVVSGPDMLRGAAIDAVRQWTYKPYLLNGNPTEVETTVSVDFSLRQ